MMTPSSVDQNIFPLDLNLMVLSRYALLLYVMVSTQPFLASCLLEYISLSTIVFNSRDWSEIVWLPKILHFINQPCNRLYPKKTAGIHWSGYNDAVSWLNETKTQIFQPTANFEIFEIYLYFVCLPACLPAVRPGCARCSV